MLKNLENVRINIYLWWTQSTQKLQFSFDHMTRPKKCPETMYPPRATFWYGHPFIHPSSYRRSGPGAAAPAKNPRHPFPQPRGLTLAGDPQGLPGQRPGPGPFPRSEHLPRKAPWWHSELLSMLGSRGSILNLFRMTELLFLSRRETPATLQRKPLYPWPCSLGHDP